MIPQDDEASSHEKQVNEAIAAYFEAADAGRVPDRAEFLSRYPEIATELAAFLDDRDRFQRLAQPLERGRAAAEAATVAPHSGTVDGLLGTVRYFGDYELLEEIARGGMGVVFKARQVSLDRIVALKMILAGQLASSADVQRFHTEARSAAALRHPNIVAIHEVGEYQGQHFFSMDYIAGKSLAEIVRENPLPSLKAAGYVRTVAEAIQHAHDHGTLHRDLKPSNVLIDEADRPHVTDFGLAKQNKADAGVTATGQILGTPSYMPPEQAASRRGEIGPASDVYSLGALLYELITGRPPFRAETVFDTIMQVLETEPVPPRMLNPKVPLDLDTICLKCLEKDPAKRYSSAQQLADDLARFQSGEPILARPPSIPFVVRQWFRQNLRATMWTAAIGLAAGLLMSFPAFLTTRWIGHVVGSRFIAEPVLVFAVPGDPSMGVPLPLPPSVQAATAPIILLVAVFQGLLAALVVRPANAATDVAVGAGSGLVAGLVFFLLALGPVLNLQIGVVPSQSDLRLLARTAASTAPALPGRPADPIAEAYPDLASLDRAQRCGALQQKIDNSLRLNGPRALWIAMVLSLMTVPVGVIFALVGGLILRRGDRSIGKTLTDYHPSFVGISFGAFLLFTLFVWIAVVLGYFPPKTPWWFALTYLPFVSAVILHKRHRKLYQEPIWRRNLTLALALFATICVSLVRFADECWAFLDACLEIQMGPLIDLPMFIDVPVYAVTLVLVIRYLSRQRAPMQTVITEKARGDVVE